MLEDTKGLTRSVNRRTDNTMVHNDKQTNTPLQNADAPNGKQSLLH